MPIDIKSLSWLNPPLSTYEDNGTLYIATAEATDFWQETYYGFHRDSGHFLHMTRQGDFTATTTFSASYEELYDQAGIMIRANETHWMKCGIEFTDGAKHFSVVVTNGHSDWSAFRIDHDFEEISVRVTRNADALFVQYRTNAMTAWHMARLAYFDPAFEEIKVGMMCCSPQRQGFTASFLDFTVTDPVSRDIH